MTTPIKEEVIAAVEAEIAPSLVDALADEIMKTIRQCRPCLNALALDLFVAALPQGL